MWIPHQEAYAFNFPEPGIAIATSLGGPLKYIDPNGELWFNVNGTWTYLEGVDEITQESTDSNGNAVITVIAGLETFVGFDGGVLTLHQKDGTKRTFEATSGVLDEEGRTQPNLVRERGRGPVPEGRYFFNPALIQYFDDLGLGQKAASLARRGEWPGGTVAWGRARAQLRPDSSTNTFGRSGFFIHGGFVPGSAGCIDLCDQDADFFSAVPSTGAEILVVVDYP